MTDSLTFKKLQTSVIIATLCCINFDIINNDVFIKSSLVLSLKKSRTITIECDNQIVK